MASWDIVIKKGANGGITFDPNPLEGDVKPGDLVVFRNRDDVAHLLGLPDTAVANHATYYMPGPIAPGSSSPNFVVGKNQAGATFVFVDYDIATNQPKPGGATGTIKVAAWFQIAINKKSLGSAVYVYAPPALTVPVGATVSWMNNDDVPHWPGISGYPNFFMPAAIPPGTSSLDQGPWKPDPNVVDQTLTYVDTQDGSASPPSGTIAVVPAPGTP
ncbi:MAG TPA: hypothetical protein VFB22_11255 [Candidatus Baltobacteraceae bacterium]|nr:hypothetical protein [Candidatus Baltobacteraceae bacterium]